jgi:HK97 family phage prohead protease
VDRVTYKATFRSVEDSGEFEALLSAPTLDRDGEIIDARAFEPLPSIIPIHRDHDMSTRGLVGSAEPYYDDDGLLRAKGTFFGDSDGQRMRTYAKSGVLSMSVGFMSSERQKDASGVSHIKRAELLEASFVSVPSNRDAAITAVKSAPSAEVDMAALAAKVDDLAATVKSMLDVMTAPESSAKAEEKTPAIDGGDTKALAEWVECVNALKEATK